MGDPLQPEQRLPGPGISLTPMLSQYLEIKKNYTDAILFYRMGDFYEMFQDDALKAAPLLEVALTSRDKNVPNPIPMCGVPHHAASVYIQKLVKAGLKVAICEQVEDPSKAKGLVKREVIRVVTPSLIGDPELVADEKSNILICLSEKDGKYEIGLLDLLAGEIRIGVLGNLSMLMDFFHRHSPKEVLISEFISESGWFKELIRVFSHVLVTKRSSYFDGSSKRVLNALQSYVKETQKIGGLSYLKEPTALFSSQSMYVDSTSLAALEVLKASSGEGPGLFGVLDRTCTPMGRRILKQWLSQPLCDRKKIEERLGAVQNIVTDTAMAGSLRSVLSRIRDLERLTMKTALGLSMPRDLVAIREMLKQIPTIKNILRGSTSLLLETLRDNLILLEDLTAHLDRALEDEPPTTLKEGGLIRETYRPEILQYRSLVRDTKGHILAIESRERTRTGISSLKVKYSHVFGYTIEITKSHLDRVPADYIRKQTIANGERFITEELKHFEERVISGEQKLRALEEELFLSLRQEVARLAGELLENSRKLAELDALLGFASVSNERGYVCPTFHDGWDLEIVDGRHPMIETLVPNGEFVPNNVFFGKEDCRTLLITGPNMAGKSTIMRQVAILSLMAQAGCFVSASSARLPLVDAIYTRIGSSDDISRGRSTFMVEMIEVARILESATCRSLILIDEIGRGTSTYDGLALAWSLLEFIHNEIGAKTLFATHFQELTGLQKSLPQLKNMNVLVEKWKEEIVFLHKLAPGICNQSYGVEVAKLAHLPSKVLLRAREILGCLESQSQRADRARSRALQIHDSQMAFFDVPEVSETRMGTD